MRHTVAGRVAVVMMAALLGGALTGWLTWPDQPASDRPPGAAAAAGQSRPDAASTTDSATPDPRPPTRTPTRTRPLMPGAEEEAAAGPRPPGVPRQLRIPALDLLLPVQPEGVDEDGAMALPETVDAAGWYRYGPRPGSPTGAAVVAGHVDTAEEGVGALAGLVGLEVGDRIAVDAVRGTVDYTVTEVDLIARRDLDLSGLFTREGAPRLHLVTCGGDYLPQEGGYESNVVVVAVPIARSTPAPGTSGLSSGG